MQITITRRLAGAIVILVILSISFGVVLGRVVDPPQQITGQAARDVMKYCTRIFVGDIPPPFNSYVPPQYLNGSYAIYSCKVS